MDRPALELADIVREHGPAFVAGHRLSAGQRQALRAVAACGTAALGGHAYRCLDCGQTRVCYNACRNRHCPRCQGAAQARWLAREVEHLLPVEYHHVVFTLPPALTGLPPANRPLLYELLFRAASAAIRQVAADPRYLGAQVGLLLVLHTWGQTLQFHPHVHGVVTGGGLACDASGQVVTPSRWVSCRVGFFLPVRVLSRVFRAEFVAGLRSAAAAGQLVGLPTGAAAAAWWASLGEPDWVVYSQPPLAGPEVVLKYLARYTARVALSNRRLVSCADGRVTFTAKDYADGGRVRRLVLSAEEFLRRWVQHVLPAGFVKVRHYGLLANRQRESKLAECRRLLWPRVLVGSVPEVVVELPACPCCGGRRWQLAGEVAAEPVRVVAVVGVDSS
jgi:Putative transposase/Transposase zinc-binding domain